MVSLYDIAVGYCCRVLLLYLFRPFMVYTLRYVSEVVPADLRGGIDHLSQIFVSLGVMGALLVNWALPHTEWRAMFAVGVAHAVVLGIGECFCWLGKGWLAGRMIGILHFSCDKYMQYDPIHHACGNAVAWISANLSPSCLLPAGILCPECRRWPSLLPPARRHPPLSRVPALAGCPRPHGGGPGSGQEAMGRASGRGAGSDCK